MAIVHTMGRIRSVALTTETVLTEEMVRPVAS